MARSVPTTTYHTPGDPVTGRVWNYGPKALNDFLSLRPSFRGRSHTSQAVVNNTWTPVQYPISVMDTDGGHNVGVNNTRYTSQVPGWYWVKGSISWNPTGVTNVAARIDTAITLTGGFIAGSSQFLTKGNQVNSAQQASAIVFIQVGDYVELFVRQLTGATQSVDFGFGIECGLEVLWIRS